jgi:hypothetical protein
MVSRTFYVIDGTAGDKSAGYFTTSSVNVINALLQEANVFS